MSLLAAVVAGLLAAPSTAQVPPPETQRISFDLATGPVSGSYMSLGETIARIISHPSGVARCEVEGVCGLEGLIATSRSSSGSVANALAVNSGRVKSAIIQADVAAAAFAGEGPFAKTGRLTHLRAIARLHDEAVHFVVRTRSKIKRLRDLKGQRVAIDAPQSATNHTVHALLATAGIAPASLKLSFQNAEQAARDLRDGKLDAFFAIGVAPIPVVDGLVRRGQARVVGLDARTAGALARNPMFSKIELPADTYRGSKPVTTANVATLWVVHESLPPAVAESILRSLWNPANRAQLRRLGTLSQTLNVKKAAENLPLPLHEGATRFYAEAGR